MIIFLYIEECLKALKAGRLASIAVTIGASWPGASIASIDFPKQISNHSVGFSVERGVLQVITSMDMHRNA